MAEKGGKPGDEREKARRLAEALRQNLRRRKARARARAGDAIDAGKQGGKPTSGKD